MCDHQLTPYITYTFSFLQTGQYQPLFPNVGPYQKPQNKSCISG